MARWNRDVDTLATVLSDESGVKGSCPGLARPADSYDVQQIVRECAGLGRKLLPVGEQTATTGAAVPQDDWVVSTRKLTGVVDIDRERMLVEVLPGTITAEVKRAVATEGLYYPPDPTSENECSIGGNIASNASGARTFRWGMTRRWVEGLEVVFGTGETQTFWRRTPDKNTAGYGPFQDPVDLFVGSEGTLGVITRAWLRVVQDPGPFIAVVVFFPTLSDALKVAVGYRSGSIFGNPRCVELFDRQALNYVAAHPSKPDIPITAGSGLYLEFDETEGGLEETLERRVFPLKGHEAMVDGTLVASTDADKRLIRELRHLVPESGNVEAKRYHEAGGLKVSTEFAVPSQRLLEIMSFVEETARESGVDLLARYGHVGNGHPHIFMRGRSLEEVVRLKLLAHRWCQRAVEMGGTVSGEHGIGKTRRDFLRYAYPPTVIEAMRAVKSVFDPVGIFARGNIFPETESLVPEFFGDL